MNESERKAEGSVSRWKIVSAMANHAVLWFLCLVELVAVPRFIRLYDDMDYQLPALTMIVIKLYSTCRSVWIFLPLPILGLFAADALIMYLLFRSRSVRILGRLWYFAVMLGLLLFAAFIAAALLLPLSALR
jgi:type II secretory pathway component PulF